MTIGVNGALTTIFPLTSSSLNECLFLLNLSFDGITWLAAAKLIKQMCAIPLRQQQLWWILFTACSSSNVGLVIESLTLTRGTLWQTSPVYSCYAVGASTILFLLILLVAATNDSKEQTSKNNEVSKDPAVNYQWYRVLLILAISYKFWFIAILNSVLWTTKWVVMLVDEQISLGTFYTILNQYPSLKAAISH